MIEETTMTKKLTIVDTTKVERVMEATAKMKG